MACPSCCRYILLTPCPGETGAPDMYIDERDLPDEATVKLIRAGEDDYYCYQVPGIDTSAERVKVPEGGLITAGEGTSFEDCSECDSSGDEEDSSGSGSGGGGGPLYPGGGHGGGTGGTGGGGWGGGGGGGGPACYRQATLCGGNDDPGWDLYIPCNCIAFGTTHYFRYAGRCWSINNSPTEVEEVPEGARSTCLGGTFASCAECSQFIKAAKCIGSGHEDQPGYAEAPDIYVWKKAVDDSDLTGPVTFAYGLHCYTLDPEDAAVVPPPDATVLWFSVDEDFLDQFEDCGSCLTGLQATLCAPEDQFNVDLAPDVWVKTEDLPEDFTIFRYAGWCWQIDPAGTPTRIPSTAVTVVPEVTFTADEFEDACHVCICGEPDEVDAVKVTTCPNQSLLNRPIKDYWVKGIVADNYTSLRVWAETDNVGRSVVYVFDPNKARQKAPKDANFIDPPNTYSSCYEGVNAANPNPNPPPSPPTPPNPPAPPPPPILLRELLRCYSLTPTNLFVSTETVQGENPGEILRNSAGQCFVTSDWTVNDIGQNKPDLTTWTYDFEDCEECRPICTTTWERAWDCVEEIWTTTPYQVAGTSSCPSTDVGTPGWSWDRSEDGMIYYRQELSAAIESDDCISGGCGDVSWPVFEGYNNVKHGFGSASPNPNLALPPEEADEYCNAVPEECPEGLDDEYYVAFDYEIKIYDGPDATGTLLDSDTGSWDGPSDDALNGGESAEFCGWVFEPTVEYPFPSSSELPIYGESGFIQLDVGTPQWRVVFTVRTNNSADIELSPDAIAVKSTGLSPVGSYTSLGPVVDSAILGTPGSMSLEITNVVVTELPP